MGIEKWYEVSCDICGEIVHTRSKNKEELKQYGFILIGKKVYCSEECHKTKLNKNQMAFRDNNGDLKISNIVNLKEPIKIK